MTVTVIADDHNEAITLATEKALDEANPDSWDADIEETEDAGANIIHESEDDEEDFIPRCKLTAEMFTELKGVSI